MMNDIIYKSSNIEVSARQGSTDYALISFGSATQLANGKTFWAQSVADKLDITTVGIMGYAPNWFPKSDVEAAAPIILQRLAGYNRIIGYGQSMGGYGVLKFGRQLGITTGLSFAPQYSINPGDIGPTDKRFIQHFKPELHTGMAIKLDDLPPNCFIFYDPFMREDKFNIERIMAVTHDVHLLPVYLTGHYPIWLVPNTSAAENLFAAALAGNVSAMQNQVNAVRRNRQLSIRSRYAAEKIADKAPWQALALFKKISPCVR